MTTDSATGPSFRDRTAWARNLEAPLRVQPTDLSGVASDVTESLLEEKIHAYVNIGSTTGPQPLLDLLKSRSIANVGTFEVVEKKGKGGG